MVERIFSGSVHVEERGSQESKMKRAIVSQAWTKRGMTKTTFLANISWTPVPSLVQNLYEKVLTFFSVGDCSFPVWKKREGKRLEMVGWNGFGKEWEEVHKTKNLQISHTDFTSIL